MPELPDVAVYLECLARLVVGRRLERVRVVSTFLLRSVDPPLSAVEGRRVLGCARLGKRLVLELEDELFLVLHLVVAGRLRWRAKGEKVPGRIGLAAFDFEDGTLLFTEAGTQKRAALHVVRGRAGLAAHDPGGIEPLECSLDEFAQTLESENHTLKRSLTDPHLFSGIGNAYSDEILFAARLSPLRLTRRLTAEEVARLFESTRSTLRAWIERLRAETVAGFLENVTAFREGMAVHGRHGEPCPMCAAPVQRIAYADNECNYCARCQNEGRLLADRALSRLLKDDWPKTLDELEGRRRAR